MPTKLHRRNAQKDVDQLKPYINAVPSRTQNSTLITAVDHGALNGLGDDDHTQYLLSDGARALTDDWDAGSFDIRAQTFESDVETGTAPLTIASATLVNNLNADMVDSVHLSGTGFTLTVPATGTAALLGAANVFTADQKVNVNSTTAFVVEQDGVKDNVLVVDTTNSRIGFGAAPGTYAFYIQRDGAMSIAWRNGSNLPAQAPSLSAFRSRGTTAVPLVVADDDTLFSWAGLGYDTSGTFRTASQITMLVDGAPDATTVPGKMLFRLNPGSGGSIADVLTLRADESAAFSGTVQIGTTTAGAQLTVDQASATGALPALLLDQGDASEEAIKVSYDAADVDMSIIKLDVIGAPVFGWDESEDSFSFNKGLVFSVASSLITLDGNLTLAPAADLYLRPVGSVLITDTATTSNVFIGKDADAAASSNLYLRGGAVSHRFYAYSSGNLYYYIPADEEFRITKSTGHDIAVFTEAARLTTLYDLNVDTAVTTPSIDATSNLTIAPGGDLYLNPTGNDVLPTTGYDINLGMITNKYLTLHAAELWVETLVAQDTMATIGGRILVGPTTMLSVDLGDGVGDTTITVKHNNLANGDRVVMQADGKLEWMAIASGAGGGAGAYTYTVTRDLDGTGRNLWYAGDAVFNTGTTGDGFIDLYSIAGVVAGSTAGPTIVGNVRYGTTYNEFRPAWAIGNLNGLYGYGVDTYGVGLGQYSDADYVTIDPTNGVRFLNAADAVVAQLSSGSWTLGSTSTEHVAITSESIQFKDGATVWTELSAGALFLGQTAAEHVRVSGLSIQFKDGSDIHTQLSAGVLTLGIVGVGLSNVNITSGALQLRTNTTVNLELTTAGQIIAGDDAGGEYLTIDSNGIEMFSNAIKTVDIANNGDFTIGRVATDHGNMFYDADGGTGGGGRLNFRGSTDGTVVQAYVDTDGTLMAGSGVIKLSSTGQLIATSGEFTTPLKWTNSSITDYAGAYGFANLQATDPVSETHGIFGSGIYHDANNMAMVGCFLNEIDLFILKGGAARYIVEANYDYVKTNAKLIVNQNDSDDEVIEFKSSDVSHQITDIAEGDTYGYAKKVNASYGGLELVGFSEVTQGLGLVGGGSTDDTSKAYTSRGYINIVAGKRSSNALGGVGSNANLATIQNYGTTTFIFDAEGSAHAEVEWTAFDDYDDVVLLTDLEHAMLAQKDPIKAEFVEFLQYNHQALEDAGIVHFNKDDPGHAMVNTTKLSMALVGAVRQISSRLDNLERGALTWTKDSYELLESC